MTRAIEGYSNVFHVAVDDYGQIAVEVVHGTEPTISNEESRQLSQSLYALDSAFRVIKAELGQHYAGVHRMFEEKKLLDHPFNAERDSRDLWPVRRSQGTDWALITRPERAR